MLSGSGLTSSTVSSSTRISFGVELQRLLAERGVSFRELSRRTGFSAPALHQYANGHRTPRTETIELIALALEEPPAVFVEWRRRQVLERVAGDDRLVDALWSRLR